MKHTIAIITFAALAAILTGCAATKSTITEYDASGKVVKVTETSESVIKNITESTKDKTVVAYDNSWLAYISATTATTEDPTPTVKMGIGKADKGVLTLHKDHDVAQAASIITAARAGEISVSASGASSKSTKVSDGTTTATATVTADKTVTAETGTAATDKK